MEKEIGVGIIFYTRNPKRVLLFLRDQKHSDPQKTLSYPGMLDILGGHVDGEESSTECIEREIAEEWTDLRTGKPFKLGDYKFFEVVNNEKTLTVLFCQEMNFLLTDIDYHEGTALALINEEAAMRTEIAYGFADALRKFFKSRFMND